MTNDISLKAAVDNQFEKIRRIQACIVLMQTIRNIDEDIKRSKIPGWGKLWGYLHEKLANAWNDLSWFNGCDPRANEALKQRTKTWFESESCHVMGFLNMSGQYFVDDDEKFREEVLKALDLDR